MPDLRVVAVITAKPGSESVVRDALATLVEPTRNEEGCRSYDLFESTSSPQVFITDETWNAQADLDAHMQTDHIAAAFRTADGHLAQPPAIHTLAAVQPS